MSLKTKPLTTEEADWLRSIQRLLCNPPSGRIGFYVTGDRSMYAYDATREAELDALSSGRNGMEFCAAVDQCGADLMTIRTAMNICATSG